MERGGRRKKWKVGKEWMKQLEKERREKQVEAVRERSVCVK